VIKNLRDTFNINVNSFEYIEIMDILDSVCRNNPGIDECNSIRKKFLSIVWSDNNSDIVIGTCAEWLFKHLCVGCFCQPSNVCKRHVGTSIYK